MPTLSEANPVGSFLALRKSWESITKIDLSGPYDSDYESSDAPSAPLSWTKCGGWSDLSVDTQLQLNASENPAGTAIFNALGVDGRLAVNAHLVFEPC